MEHFFIEISKTLILAVCTAYLFNRLRLPAMLGYLFAGLLAGPKGLGWISNTHDIHIMAEWGIFFLMLTIGLEFSSSRLAGIKKVSLVGGAAQLAISIVLGIAFAHMVGWTVTRGFLTGSIIALSSTAIVLKFLSEEGHLDTEYGKVALGILIFQDFAVAPLMIITNSIGSMGSDLITSLIWITLKISIFIGIIIIVSKTVLPAVLRKVASTQNREIFFLFLVILCLATASFSNIIGLSFAIGAFIAGFILANTDFAHQFSAEIIPFRHVFVSLFFVSIGLLFDVHFLMENYGMIFAVVSLVMVVNFIIMAIIVLGFGYAPRIALAAGLIMCQIGEFSFILIESSLKSGLIGEHFYQVLISATFVTMFLTPFLFKMLPLIDWLASRFEFLSLAPFQPSTSVKVKSDGLKNHVILCGFGPTGKDIAHTLKEIGSDFIVIDFNREHIEQAAKMGYKTLFGDVSNATVLGHAGIKTAKSVVISFPDPIGIHRIVKIIDQLNPAAIQCVRTRFQSEMARLYDDGADVVVTDEWEADLELNRLMLNSLNIESKKTEEIIKKIRERKEFAIEEAILKHHFNT